MKTFLATFLATFVVLMTIHMYSCRKSVYESKNNLKTDTLIVYTEPNFASTLFRVDSIGQEEPTKDNIYELFRIIGMQQKDIVYAQMRLESGNFKSNIAKKNNNMFGMTHPVQRANTSMGKKNGYATYKNWAYSVLDYRLWQEKYAYCLDEEMYLRMLSVYASDKHYVEKLKRIMK